MELIKATEKDIPVIKAIADEVWPKTFAEILSPKQIAYMMDMMYSEEALKEQINALHHHYLLAKENENYWGYLSYETNYKGKSWTKIHKIYVSSAAQGKGIGRFLIDAVARIAWENNNTELSLNVNRFNKALNFYKKLGFEVIGTEDIDIGNGFLMEDYIMKVVLSF